MCATSAKGTGAWAPKFSRGWPESARLKGRFKRGTTVGHGNGDRERFQTWANKIERIEPSRSRSARWSTISWPRSTPTRKCLGGLPLLSIGAARCANPDSAAPAPYSFWPARFADGSLHIAACDMWPSWSVVHRQRGRIPPPQHCMPLLVGFFLRSPFLKPAKAQPETAGLVRQRTSEVGALKVIPADRSQPTISSVEQFGGKSSSGIGLAPNPYRI